MEHFTSETTEDIIRERDIVEEKEKQLTLEQLESTGLAPSDAKVNAGLAKQMHGKVN